MIYFKIYFTLIFILIAIAGTTSVLGTTDDERSDMWDKISLIFWLALAVVVFVGALTIIWIFPF